MNIFQFIKPSLEGKDGKSSARALTNFWYVGLNTILSFGLLYLTWEIVKQKSVNSEAVKALWVLFYLIVVYNLTILVIFGVVTFQNINEGIRAWKGQSVTSTETVNKTESSTETIEKIE